MHNLITIQQVLHGYNNGHHQIMSSMVLTDKSKRKMDILSDLSGPDIQEGFMKYYTGYFLPNDNKVVLSCTWYANEMERPGCVWTHSLLIDPNDIRSVGSKNNLLSLFRRPDHTTNVTMYGEKIIFAKEEEFISSYIDQRKLKYLIWAIWGNKFPLVIGAENSEEYIREILYLWTKQDYNLNQGFSFSTGSLSIRKFENEILNIQIVPKYNVNNVVKSKSQVRVLKDINDIKTFPIWVDKTYELQKSGSWEDLNKFRSIFGLEFLRDEYVSKFVKIYIGTNADLHNLNIAEGLNIIDKLFNENEKENIGNLFITLYLDGNFNKWISDDNSIKILKYLINKNWIIKKSQLQQLIDCGIKNDSYNSKILLKYLIEGNMNSNICNLILSIYANLIPFDRFNFFTDMELVLCKKLVTFNPMLVLNSDIWIQNKLFQQGILDSLKYNNNLEDMTDKLLPEILNHSIHDFGWELYNLFGSKSLYIFIDYLLDFKHLLCENPISFKDVCKNNTDICIKYLSERYNELNKDQLLAILELINPYSTATNYLNYNIWVDTFYKVNSLEVSNKIKLDIALFYLPIILRSNKHWPLQIVNIVYDTITNYICKNELSNDQWARIQQVLPEITWYSKNERCKRLRKGIKSKGYRLNNDEDSDMDIFLL